MFYLDCGSTKGLFQGPVTVIWSIYFNHSNIMITMKTLNLATLFLVPGLLVATALYADSVDQAALKAEAIGIVQQFGGSLKPQLKKALMEGGPAHAISVCSVQAPEIAQNLSQSTGWSVKRVSLKARNTDAATPDAWEKGVLEQFDQRQALQHLSFQHRTRR